ncbi:hypothetical protein HF086_002751 [Spodoptera exigua]|uniref:Uncharacterized protein n=1 Tax=Spodoptera exigua TaxID=7107 RepID=A0A922SD40_SPOEX|nr:hypothetical protein HF086_002751 [Spodoptera exigua]
MSNGTSPSVLSFLRQYRFQRKPNGPAEPSSPVTVTSAPSGSQMMQNNKIRMAAPNTVVVRNVPVVYKRIRLQDSDSDDAATPAKKPAVTVELTTAVKERRFRNMLEMFPDISPIFVKNTLIKHGWSEERARDELLMHDPESNDRGSTSTFFGSKPSVSGQSAPRNYTNMGIVRVTSGPKMNVVVRKPLASKGGRDRRGSSGSEDDDYGVRKGKDDRVYDSEDSDNEITDDLIGDKKKVEKFNSNKTLSTELLNSTQELLTTRNNIQRLMKKCVVLAQQLESAVAAGAGRLKQPAILHESLKLAPYQLVGLNWLAVLHKQGVSGILADEMGLGKTVQVIAFLAHLKETGQARGTHLIVVPASTLDNWSSELSRWCPALRVSKYYGHPEERRQLRIQYARGLDDVYNGEQLPGGAQNVPHHSDALRYLRRGTHAQEYVHAASKHRLLLTGTPLQNNLLELMSLLCFVMPHMFSGKTDDLKSLFQKNAKSKTTKNAEGKQEADELPFEQSQITQAKRIMKPFVLRRLKRDVLQDLPKKTNHRELCPMSERQGILYKNLIASFSAKDGSCIQSYSLPEHLILDSGKFQKLDEMLPRLKEGGHRVLVFSQFTMMLDILEPYLTIRRHRYLRLDGSTAVTDRQELIDQYNNEDIFVFLLSTKAGGLGINLTAADTVIIHDIDFNPYNDKQAEDRCHRMGQTRPVTIYRLLSCGTIEEGIYQVAQEKLNLEKHVTGDDDNDKTEQKNVVRLLSAALGLTSPSK